MQTQSSQHLTKSRFAYGNQCLKRLYNEAHHPDLKAPVDEAQQYIFDTGKEVGILAQKLFPGGRLVDVPAYDHKQAEERTAELLADQSLPAVYEAAFTANEIRVRPDVLNRVGGNEFDLYEAKMSASVKDDHIPDAAVQMWVMEQVGLTIRKVYIVHINNQYIFKGGEPDVVNLLKAVDITDATRSFATNNLPGAAAKMLLILNQKSGPDVPIGTHCVTSYPCPFFEHCREGLPEHYVEQLPGLRAKGRDALAQEGITVASAIHDIPDSFNQLTSMQQRVRDAVVQDVPYIAPSLANALLQLTYPIHSIDFETVNPAIPRYVGTRPYQVIPFQWSLHIADDDQAERHLGFLAQTSDDPREEFISTLLDAIGPTGSIVVYSSYEETQLKSLAAEYPQYETAIKDLISRIVDIAKIVREHYYDPGFHGSFSIKSVLPALVPELDYKNLAIGDGRAASASFFKMIRPNVPSAEKEGRYDALWEYCGQDTYALIRVIRALKQAN